MGYFRPSYLVRRQYKRRQAANQRRPWKLGTSIRHAVPNWGSVTHPPESYRGRTASIGKGYLFCRSAKLYLRTPGRFRPRRTKLVRDFRLGLGWGWEIKKLPTKVVSFPPSIYELFTGRIMAQAQEQSAAAQKLREHVVE